MTNLKGLKVAILVENGFEQVELTEPRRALDQAGAETRIVSPQNGRVRAWNLTEWGDKFPVDVPLDQARADDFDALRLPGGVMNPTRCGCSRRPSPSSRRSSTRASRCQ
jgi:protease I